MARTEAPLLREEIAPPCPQTSCQIHVECVCFLVLLLSSNRIKEMLVPAKRSVRKSGVNGEPVPKVTADAIRLVTKIGALRGEPGRHQEEGKEEDWYTGCYCRLEPFLNEREKQQIRPNFADEDQAEEACDELRGEWLKRLEALPPSWERAEGFVLGVARVAHFGAWNCELDWGTDELEALAYAVNKGMELRAQVQAITQKWSLHRERILKEHFADAGHSPENMQHWLAHEGFLWNPPWTWMYGTPDHWSDPNPIVVEVVSPCRLLEVCGTCGFDDIIDGALDIAKGVLLGDEADRLAHGLCVIARASHLVRKCRPAIQHALLVLVDTQEEDGCWHEWLREDPHEPPSTRFPSALVTAQAVYALRTFGKEQRFLDAADRGSLWLLANQRSDGSWQGSALWTSDETDRYDGVESPVVASTFFSAKALMTGRSPDQAKALTSAMAFLEQHPPNKIDTHSIRWTVERLELRNSWLQGEKDSSKPKLSPNVANDSEAAKGVLPPQRQQWSAPNGLKEWSKVFDVSVTTMRRWFRNNNVKNQKVSDRRWKVAVDELPVKPD